MSSIINIIDLECCCDRGHSNIDADIIEFGISVVDYKSLEIVKVASIIVKPTTQTISSYCTTLTSITQEMVDEGVTFTEACKILRKEYASSDRIWGSWGNFDKNKVLDQCEREDILYPFGYVTHINIKTWFKLYKNLKVEVDMMKALQMLGIKHTGTSHRGSNDALHISLIFLEILKKMRS